MRNSPLIICTSYYTFLEGIHSIPELVDFAVEQGIEVLCLADRNGLYGAIEFYIHCHEVEIEPLMGADLVQGDRRVTVIARNRRGYEELSELVSRLHLRDFHIQRDLTPDSSNLLYICSDIFLLQQWLRNGPPSTLFLGLPLSDQNAFRSVLNLFIRHPHLPRIPAVPILQLNLFSASDRPFYRVLRAIHHGCTVDTLPERKLSLCEVGKAKFPLLLTADSIPHDPVLWGDKVAELCHLEFDLGHYHLPQFKPAT